LREVSGQEEHVGVLADVLQRRAQPSPGVGSQVHVTHGGDA
jgi:hypothetical protein